MMNRSFHLITSLLLAFAPSVFADETKGLLPEVRMGSNEESNEHKALSSEIMITRSENKAIESLQNLIKKRKGASEEASLWYRLAEMYMRRSKSGRFFDIHKDTKLLRLSPFPVPNETGKEAVRRAGNIYSKIERDFPTFDQMDSVLFNNAFAQQQLGKIQESQALYARLLLKFPKSPLMADGTLAYGELLYDEHKFAEALEQFKKIEKFPESRVYPYAIYKAAWAYYNLRDSDNGIKKLLEVVKANPPLREGQAPSNRHNLRREALRDLTVFIGDVYAAKEVYSFFAKITEGDELGQSMIDLAKLYESHSRQKEMNIFLDEYISRQPTGAYVVKAHLLLVDANETLKRREEVLTHLGEASQLCQKGSPWSSAQQPDTLIDGCTEGFHHASLEIAAKWWEIWLKNKQNKDFTSLTERSFKLILENEDPKKPDSKTRFAYAELLFQQGKFEEASHEYQTVGAQSQDPQLSHDGDYAALFAKEKSIEQAKDSVKESERKALALNYVAKHPTGQYARSVQFKLGYISYEENNYEEAQKRLSPLAESRTNDEFKKKSEDLMLDMLNIKKDYAGIQKFSKQILARTTDNNRKENLNKIYEEANFAEIQESAKTGDKDQTAAKLSAFAQTHANSKLANEAMWQSLSLNYTQGRTCDAAEMSLTFVEKFPNDKRTPDALKEAAKSFAECGDLTRAEETILKVAEIDKKNKLAHLQMVADMYILDKRMADARKLYEDIASQTTDKKTIEKLYSKLLATYKETDRNIEYEKLENKMLGLNIEPYSTQILTRRAKSLFDEGKWTAAFDLALKTNGRKSPPEVRAEARLLQARILEKELVKQSLKAREEKFAVVLSLKTEKLDKAQTAYVDALKMAKDPFVQLEALRGLDRSYGNYIESLRFAPLPSSLSADDQAMLRQEIAKITKPIEDKKKDNETKLKSLAVAQAQGVTSERNFAVLGADKTVPPLVTYPPPAAMKPFYPDAKVTRVLDLEKKGKEFVRNKDQRAQGLYYLSLAAESRSYTDKALWLIEQSLKLDSNQAYIQYQKARLLYQLEGMASAKAFFDKVLDMKMISPEMQAFAAVKTFSEGDFSHAVENFARMKREEIYNYAVGPMYCESFAQKGETDKALSLANELVKARKDNIDLLLEQAHLFETFKSSPLEALTVYEKIQKLAHDENMKDWLSRKINFLKSPDKVSQNATTEN